MIVIQSWRVFSENHMYWIQSSCICTGSRVPASNMVFQSKLLEGSLVLIKTGKLMMAMSLMAGILFLAGCPTRTSIADINRDPGRFSGKEVTIAGHVSEAFGALGNGIFQIDDGTGRMWVYSQNYGVPGNGNKVAVTGRVEQGFAFGGRSFGVILSETQNRH